MKVIKYYKNGKWHTASTTINNYVKDAKVEDNTLVLTKKVNGVEETILFQGGESGTVKDVLVDNISVLSESGVAKIDLTTKQDKLTAGDNITITESGVISSKDFETYYIELTGVSGTLTTEQRATLLKGSPTNNFIDKDNMIFKCVYYKANNKAVYSISGESKVHVITVVLPAGTWNLVTYELMQLLGKEAVSSEPYHFPYHFETKFEDGKIKIALYTITLDNNKTLKQYEKELDISDLVKDRVDVGNVEGAKIWAGTKAEYDAITEKDEATLYYVTDDADPDKYYTKDETDDLLSAKQDVLVAGDNIIIESGTKVISATNVVTTNTDQEVGGNKSFSGKISIITPIDTMDAANKQYVDEAVSSGSATYRGSFATKADLDAYTGDMEKGDYAIVASDETHENKCTRYKCMENESIKSWVFEYVINDSPFTTAQLAALNSGITTEKVTEFGAKMNSADGIGTGTTTLENLKVTNKAQVLAAPTENKDIINLEYFKAHIGGDIDKETIIIKDEKMQTSIGGVYIEERTLTPLSNKSFTTGYGSTVTLGVCPLEEGDKVRFVVSNLTINYVLTGNGCDVTKTIGSDKSFARYGWQHMSGSDMYMSYIWIDASGNIKYQTNGSTQISSGKVSVTITRQGTVKTIHAEVIPIDGQTITVNSDKKLEAKAKYQHNICASDSDTVIINFSFINSVPDAYTTNADVSLALYNLGFTEARKSMAASGTVYSLVYGTASGNFCYWKNNWASGDWGKITDTVVEC